LRVGLAFILLLLVSASLIGRVNTGTGVILPASISNTILSVSFSYPDSIKSNQESFNISLTISVTFHNQSLQIVNITRIEASLENINTDVTPYTGKDKYWLGSEWTWDEFENPVCTLRKSSYAETASEDFQIQMTRYYGLPSTITEVKLYIEIWFRIPRITMRQDPFVYPWYYGVLYTGSGECGRINISKSISAPDYITPVIYVSIGIIIVSIIIGGYAIYKSKKTKEKHKIA